MRILAKIGGAALAEPAARAQLALDVRAVLGRGHAVCLVHGGGPQLGALTTRLGLTERRVAGLRVTDGPTADAALQVLGGEVNRKLVAALVAAGVPAVGLTGADGGLYTARRLAHPEADLGYVGEVAAVEPALLEHLVGGGYVPVVASVAPPAPGRDAADDRFLNVNADHAAAPLAEAFRAEAVLFLSDVPGVLDADGRILRDLAGVHVRGLARDGVLAGGMLPKVEAALLAARARPGALVRIASATAPDALCAALASGDGTTFHAEQET